MTREELIEEAIERCMKELYSYAQPDVEWDDFMEQNKEYMEKYRQWESYMRSKRNKDKQWEEWKQIHPDWEGKTIDECIGLKPYEFYYLPQEVMKVICDSYVSAYKFDNQKELEENKDTLIHYCEEPIVDAWIEEENGDRHRGYRHPESLENSLKSIIGKKKLGTKAWEEVKKYLNMATDFYSWNRELNTFNANVYLGGSPHSIKEKVIENWKTERGKDIEIDDTRYYKFEDKYYGWYEEEEEGDYGEAGDTE